MQIIVERLERDNLHGQRWYWVVDTQILDSIKVNFVRFERVVRDSKRSKWRHDGRGYSLNPNYRFGGDWSLPLSEVPITEDILEEAVQAIIDRIEVNMPMPRPRGANDIDRAGAK